MANGGTLVLKILRWLAKRFPATPLSQVATLTYDELRSKYRQTDRWVQLAGLFLFVGLCFGYFFLLVGIADWKYDVYAKSPFVARFQSIEWGILAGLLAMASFPILFLESVRAVLGNEEFCVYAAYVNHAQGESMRSDGVLLSRRLFALLTPVLMAITILAMDSCTVFTEEGIIFNSFWTLGSSSEHPYSAVRGLYESRSHKAPAGQQVESVYQVIVFDDKTRWTSEVATPRLLPEQRKIMNFVSSKSGQPYQVIARYEDIPP